MQTPAVRRPAVAGRFYPGKVEALTQQLDQCLGVDDAAAPEITAAALGCIVPHAGYMYSGQVAGAVFRRLPARSTYIILCPNHTGRGAPLAMMSKGEWLTPLGPVPIDAALAARLQQSCRLLAEDAKAHEGEHAIEVELPFLQRSVGAFSFVPIAIGVSRYAALEALGHGMAQALKSLGAPVMVVASSDMNHYEPDDVTRVKDHLAIDHVLALDPAGLYDTVRDKDISMCGYGPAVAMLTAVKDLGATRAELIRYATSGDANGDRSAVVGYAGMVVS
jgi:AmmeMemoRadiSam system protein B